MPGIQSGMAEKGWGQEQEAAGHSVSIVRKSINAGSQHSSFHSAQDSRPYHGFVQNEGGPSLVKLPNLHNPSQMYSVLFLW